MRLVLALCAALVTLVGRAEAKVISCSCPTRIVLPQNGATGLPTNAKVWVIDQTLPPLVRRGDAPRGVRTRDDRTSGGGTIEYTATRPGERPIAATQEDQHWVAPTQPPADLAPNTTFTDNEHGIEFTVGSEADHTPPRAPRNVAASIWTTHYGNGAEILSLSAFGDYDPETAIVEIELGYDGHITTLQTTPSRLFLCNESLGTIGGRVTVSIRSIDIAGNVSDAFETTVDSHFEPTNDTDVPCTGGYHRHRGHGFEILGLIFLWLIFLVCWLVYLLGRRAGAKRGLAEEVPVLAAEEIVRRLLRWQVVWTAMLAIAIFGLYAADDDMALVSVLLAPVGIVAFCRLIVVHYASRLLHREEASATRYGRWLCIQTLRDSQLVRASDADFVAGKRASLPKSVMR